MRVSQKINVSYGVRFGWTRRGSEHPWVDVAGSAEVRGWSFDRPRSEAPAGEGVRDRNALAVVGRSWDDGRAIVSADQGRRAVPLPIRFSATGMQAHNFPQAAAARTFRRSARAATSGAAGPGAARAPKLPLASNRLGVGRGRRRRRSGFAR
jgi:hypothetical protein